MGTIITKNSNNPFYVEDILPISAQATIYVENAPKIVVYTGSDSADVVPDVHFIGSGAKAALKHVAAGANNMVDGKGKAITLTNLTVKDVYGGAITTDAKGKVLSKLVVGVGATFSGSTNITIENGSYKNVYGGGAGFGATVTGDTTVNYKGGKISALYGGGGGGSVVEGNANVNIYGSPAGGSLSKVFGGGLDSTVEGDTTITLMSDANLGTIKSVSGGGAGKKAVVGGSRNLVFDNSSGTFGGKITNFTDIQFIGAVNVTVNKLDKSLASATYEFVLTDDSLKNVNAMLTVAKPETINNVVVTIDSNEMVSTGGEVILIASSGFRTADSFNAAGILVQNSTGQQISEIAYDIDYDFSRRGGTVTIDYLGSTIVLDGTQDEKIVLGGADDEVNIIGGKLVAGLDTDGGDDIVNVQAGAVVNGGLRTGEGNDILYVQKDSEINGYVDMDGGDDRLVVNEEAILTSDVFMGSGTNVIDVNRFASITGRIILEDGSTNTINVKSGAIGGIDSGDSTTTNTLIFDGSPSHGGGVGNWEQVFVPGEEFQPGYYISVFDRQDLILGDSQDTVTFNSHAAVCNIILGGGDDVLLLRDDAYVADSIYLGDGNDILTVYAEASIAVGIHLGAGDDLLVLNGSYSGILTAHEGENVIVANSTLSMSGDFLNLGSTNNVVVISNGAQLTLTDITSLGNFLSSVNDTVYFSQNATVEVETPGMYHSETTKMIQSYTGQLTAAGDLYVLAPIDPLALPTTITNLDPNYYAPAVDGVQASNIAVGGDFVLFEGATVDGSAVNVTGDAELAGTLSNSMLMATDGSITGTATDSALTFSNDATIDGTVSGGSLDVGNDLLVNMTGGVTVDPINVGNDATIDGVVLGQTLAVGNDLLIDNAGVVGVAEVTVGNDAQVDGQLASTMLDVVNDLTVNGTANVDEVAVGNDAMVAGLLAGDMLDVGNDLTVDGTVNVTDVTVGNNATVNSVLSLNGDTLVVGNDLDVDGAVNVADVTVGNDATVGGTLTGDTLAVGNDLDVDGTVTVADVAVVGNLDVNADGTVNATAVTAGSADVDGAVNADTLDVDNALTVGVDGVVTADNVAAGSVMLSGLIDATSLTADTTVEFAAEGADFTGTDLTAGTKVIFDFDYTNAALVVSTPIVDLATDAKVIIASTDAAPGVFGTDAILTEVVSMEATAGDLTEATAFDTGYTVTLLGSVGADITFDNNDVIFANADAPLFDAMVYLTGDNEFAITGDSWFDWQQLVFNVATLGFDIADNSLLAIDGYVDVDPMTAIVDETAFGQNSRLAIGEWLYIQDWNGPFVLPQNQNVFPEGNATNLDWNNLYVTADAAIWGPIAMNDEANEVVISDGVEINGRIDLYDYAAILTLGGDDTVTVGAATINGTIFTREGDDTLTLNGSMLNVAINQGKPAIEMGLGNDTLDINSSVVNGDITTDSGDDEITITDSTITGDINTGSGADILTIDPTVINGNIDTEAGADEVTIIESTVNGNVSTGTDGDILKINTASLVTGNVDLGSGDNDAEILDSTVGGDLLAGSGADIVQLDTAAIGGDVALGDGANEVAIVDSTVGGDLLTGSGADDVWVDNSAIAGEADLGDGDNSAVIIDSTVGGPLTTGAGADEIGILGSTIDGAIELGDADDILDIFGSTVNGNIDMGAGADTLIITDSNTTINGDILLGEGNNNATLTNSVVTGGMTAGDGDDTVVIQDATSIGDIDLGDGVSSLDILNGSTTGAVTLGNGTTNDVTIDESKVLGSLLVGNGINTVTINDTDAGTPTVDGDLSMGYNGSDNTLNAGPGGVAGDLSMGVDPDGLNPAADNTINVTGAFSVGGTVTLESGSSPTNTIDVAAGGDLDVTGDLGMTGLNNEIYLGDQNGLYDNPALPLQPDPVGGTRSLTVGGTLTMDGNANLIDTHNFDAKIDLDKTVDAIDDTLEAAAINMNGPDNQLLFGVNAEVDGEIIPPGGVHRQSIVRLNEIDMTLTAPVTMYSADMASVNEMIVGLELQADQEGDIYLNGPANFTVTGNVGMSGYANEFAAGIAFQAINEAEIHGGNQDVTVMIDGVVSQTTDVLLPDGHYALLGGFNAVELGYVEDTTSGGPTDGAILNPGNYTTTLTGGITQTGVGSDNFVGIAEGVTVGGPIAMGTVSSDQLSNSNTLIVADPGSIQGQNVRLIAVENYVELMGTGTVGPMVEIWGRDNELLVGPGITITDDVTFGSIFDDDGIGVPGYLIQQNELNEVLLEGIVTGDINTDVNLGTPPLGYVNDSKDIIELIGDGMTTGAVGGSILTGNYTDYNSDAIKGDEVYVTDGSVGFDIITGDGDDIVDITDSTVGNDILTGDGNDTVLIDGSVVGNDVIMGDPLALGGATGTNDLTVVALLDTALGVVVAGADSTVTNDVTMDSDERNRLRLEGKVFFEVGAPPTAFFANVGGNVAMTAQDPIGDIGRNRLDLIGPTNIGGTITMNADASNELNMAGIVDTRDPNDLLDPGTEQVWRSTIVGDLAMTALSSDVDHDFGENTLNMGVVTSITGDVTMDAGVSNTVNVDTGWIKVFGSGGAIDGTYDSTSDVQSLDLLANTNALNVNGGELIITEASGAGVDSITMKNRQRNDVAILPTNTITVADDARLISETGVNMGNLATASGSGAYSYTTVTLDGNSVEVFYFDYTAVPASTVFDTDTNTIAVKGKMYTGNIVASSDTSTYGGITQVAINNNIKITGPATINLPDVPVYAGPFAPLNTFLETTSILATGVVIQNGVFNSIDADPIAPGEAALVVDDIIQQGAMPISSLAQTNEVLVDANAHFFGQNITQDATDNNTIDISGVRFPGAGTDGQDTITESNVDGAISQFSSFGDNSTDLLTTDVGNVDIAVNAIGQQADDGGNTLDVSGDTIARVTTGVNDEILLQPTVVVDSTVNGAITQQATDSNSAILNITDVNGAITQTAGTDAVDDNILISTGLAQVANTAIDPVTTFPVLVEAAVIDNNVLGGLITQTAGGVNTLFLNPTDVGGGITMTAGLNNDLDSLGAELVAIPSQDPVTADSILLQGTIIDANVISGDVLMDAGTSNDALLTVTDIGGSMTMDAFDDNFLFSAGSQVGPVIGIDSATGYNILLQAPIVDQNEIAGSLSMINVDGLNMAQLDATDVIGDFTVSGWSVNGIGSYGTVFAAVQSQDPITDDVNLISGALVVNNQITGNVSVTSMNSLNDVDLINTDVAGGVALDALTTNTLDIEGIVSPIQTGLTAPVLGIQNDQILENTSVTKATVGGVVSLTSATDDNTLNLDVADTGGVAMTTAAGGNNTLNSNGQPVFGYVSMDDAGGGGANEVYNAFEPNMLVFNEINGDVTMTTADDGVVDSDAINFAGLFVTNIVGGDLAMTTDGEGVNIALLFGSSVDNGITMQADSDNTLISDSGVGPALLGVNSGTGLQELLSGGDVLETTIGGIDMISVAGENVADLIKVDVTANGINMDAGLVNDLDISVDGFGVVNGILPAVIATAGTNVGGILQPATAIVSDIVGDVNMTSNYTDSVNIGTLNDANIAYADITGSINQTAVYGTVPTVPVVPGQVINDLLLENSHVTADIDQTTPNGSNDAKITASLVDGNVTQTTANGWNVLNIDPSTVGGDVDMTASRDNDLDITGEVIPNGPITQPGGAGTEEFMDATVVDESSVVGTVTMLATLGSNDADLLYGNAGAVDMTARLSNTLNVTGYAIPEILGYDGLGDPTGKVLQVGEVVTSDIAGNVDMTSNYDLSLLLFGLNITNDFNLTYGTVGGNVTMTSNYGSLSGSGSPVVVVNDADIIDSDVIGSITMNTPFGTNDLFIDPSTVDGGINMTTGDDGENILDINDSTIGTGIALSAGSGFFSYVDLDEGSELTAGGINVTSGQADIDIFGTVAGGVQTAGESDFILVGTNGTLNGNSDTGAGSDWFTLNGMLTGNLDMGDGDDHLSINLTGPSTAEMTGDVNMGADDDVFTLDGELTGAVDMGSGNDTYTLNGTQTGSVNMGTGADTFTLNGTLNSAIDTGAGNDILNINAAFGTGTHPISMGSGTDTANIDLASFDLSHFVFDAADNSGSLTVDGNGATAFSVSGDSLGVAGLALEITGGNLTVGDDTDVTILAGDVTTGAASTVLEATGLGDGDVLIDGGLLDSWDILDDGGDAGSFEIELHSTLSDGDAIDLVDNYEIDLADWNHNDITLDLSGADVTLVWDAVDSYVGSAGSDTWTLDMEDADTLQLTFTVSP